MKYKIPFALIVGGIIVFPPITSRIISPSIFMSLGFSEKIAIASYISLTFFVIAAALAVIFVAGVKLSQFSRAGVVELDRINEREEPNIGKPTRGKIKLSKNKEIPIAESEKKKGDGGWFSCFGDDSSSGRDSG
ncbi:hypothetical protein, partial [Pseudomonas savastanoi]